MLRYLDSAKPRESVAITVDGVPMHVRADETLAAVLLQSARRDFRTTAISGTPRSAYCMMGTCFECLVTIDDQPDQQACMTLVRSGMRVERQAGVGNILRSFAIVSGR